MPLPPEVLAALDRAKLRSTRSRLAVLEEMATAGSPLSTAELIERAGAHGVPSSTVYGTLAVLEAAGVVTRLAFGEEFARYEISDELTGGHHHHFVCRNCGAVDDLDRNPATERALDRLAEQLAQDGRVIESHRLDLLGVCASCAATTTGLTGF